MVSWIKNNLKYIILLSGKFSRKLIVLVSPSSEYLGPPQHFASNGKEFYEKNRDKHSFHYEVVCNEEVIAYDFKLPKTSELLIHKAFNIALPVVIPEQYILVLKEGRVFGINSTVIAPGDFVILDQAREFGKNYDPLKLSVFRKFKLPRVKNYDGIVGVIGHAGTVNYFHWMVNILPRLLLLKKSGWLEKCDKLIVNKLSYAFQFESLEHLGVSPQKMIEADEKLHLKAQTLVAPSVPQFDDHVPLWVLDFLRETFLKNVSKPELKKKIYITRKKAATRRIINEEDVISLLKGKGFFIYELEEMSIREQAELFNASNFIVAPHGAAQTNIVFCEPGTKLLEFFPQHWASHIYWSICNQLKMDYYYLSEHSDSDSNINYSKFKESNIQVSILHLEKIIDKIEMID